MPHEYIITGECISPYQLFSNTHDGSGAIKVALTPIRIVCNNTLNLALSTAKRSWSMIHTGDIQSKMKEAKDTLFMAEQYISDFATHAEPLRKTANYKENLFATVGCGDQHNNVYESKNIDGWNMADYCIEKEGYGNTPYYM